MSGEMIAITIFLICSAIGEIVLFIGILKNEKFAKLIIPFNIYVFFCLFVIGLILCIEKM